MTLRRVPVLNHLALLAVETEAAILALRELKECGLWSGKDTVEAGVNLLSYVAAVFGFRDSAN